MAFQYFDRKYKLTVGPIGGQGIVVSDLQFQFTALKTVTKEPNKLDGKVYNLSPDSRKYFVKDNIVTLEVAYGNGQYSTIFIGSIVNVMHNYEAPDIATVFDAGDAYHLIRDSVTSRNFPANVSVDTIIRLLAKDLGLAIGSFDNGSLGVGRGLDRKYKKGYSVIGSTKPALDTVCQANDLLYMIQDGTLTVVPVGSPNREGIVLVDPTTGLLGSPEMIEIDSTEPKEKKKPTTAEREQKKETKQVVEKRTYNGVRFKTLMNPEFRLSRRVMLESKFITPPKQVTIQKITHKGDWRGGDWSTEIEALI